MNLQAEVAMAMHTSQSNRCGKRIFGQLITSPLGKKFLYLKKYMSMYI